MKSEPIIQLFFIVFLVGFLLPPPVSYIENFSIVAEEEFLITDFEYKFPQRKIVWVNPEELVPHEYTSSEHLEKLCAYLRTLQTTTLLPVPVVSKVFHRMRWDGNTLFSHQKFSLIASSHPRVILDGHHRVAASIKLGVSFENQPLLLLTTKPKLTNILFDAFFFQDNSYSRMDCRGW